MNIFSRLSTGTSLEISLEEGTIRSSISRQENSFWAHLNERIHENVFLELALLFFTFSTGIQDASVVSVYYIGNILPLLIQ